MKQRNLHSASALAGMLILVAACDQEPEVISPPGYNDSPVDTANVEPPPMVARSAAYRCDDGQALYIDFLTDNIAVNVRDSRADIPTRLARQEGETYSGEGRSLTGTGDEVSYSSPERPEQSCRIGEA